MKISVMTMWYNEEFLAPFFLRHYQYADTIHILYDMDTNDRTMEKIEQSRHLCKDIRIHEFRFPDMMDDCIKIEHFNQLYKTIDEGYVFLVDADEFIFYPPGYLEEHREAIHFTKLWNVFRHPTEKDLDPNLPIREQRQYGRSAFEGLQVFTKPNIVKSNQNIYWRPGHHDICINGEIINWKRARSRARRRNNISGYLLEGAHWAMADPCFSIKRRVEDRRDRQSQVNLSLRLTRHQHNITEESLRESFREHENDTLVLP
jgi:hypothetical protein